MKRLMSSIHGIAAGLVIPVPTSLFFALIIGWTAKPVEYPGGVLYKNFTEDFISALALLLILALPPAIIIGIHLTNQVYLLARKPRRKPLEGVAAGLITGLIILFLLTILLDVHVVFSDKSSVIQFFILILIIIVVPSFSGVGTTLLPEKLFMNEKYLSVGSTSEFSKP